MEHALVQVFTNDEFGVIRTVIVNGEIYFVGVDVAIALGYKNTRSALARHVYDEDKGVSQIATPSGVQQMTVINESGVYSLVFSSKLPRAKEFKRWITSVVIPSIRKNGYYGVPNYKQLIENPQFLIEMGQAIQGLKAANSELTQQVIEVKAANSELTQQVTEMTPKAEYCEQFMNCNETFPVTTLAKNYGMTAQKMNQLLNDLHIQYKCQNTWVLYQEHAQKGWAVIINRTNAGHAYASLQWTAAGMVALYDILKKAGYLPITEGKE